jgi:plasmid stabilization system protein ParE
MISYRLSDEAFEDLSEIWHYIAFDSRAAADRFEQSIFDACESMASLPFVGVVRTDLTARPVRFRLLLPYRTHWIIYNPASRPIKIVRILHTSVDISAVLR